MITKTDIAASRTDGITSKRTAYAVNRPAAVAGQQLGISIDRSGWTDPTVTITLTLEISQDGGASWRHWCGLTDRGGPGFATAEWASSAPPVGALVRITTASNGKRVTQPISFIEVK